MPGRRLIREVSHAVIAAVAFTGFAVMSISSGLAAQGAGVPNAPSEVRGPNSRESQISETLRYAVTKVVVIAGQSPPSQDVSGSYKKATAGLVGGMDAGSRMGTITREIGGVPVYIPIIFGLTIPGAILGGLVGVTQGEIQEFRDRLTKEIARSDNPTLQSDGLALDVFWGIRRLPSVESHLFGPNVQIPSDTDSVLYVSLDGLSIDVQGKEAIITTSATATLRRLNDGVNVYVTEIKYQDRDTLSNWTRNENALWRDYANFARFYLGRELSADVFDRVVVSHELRPAETDTVKRARKDKRKFSSRSQTPTLAWELELDGTDSHNAWTKTIDEADIFYDVEIFDNRQLVYFEEQVPNPSHTVNYKLEACQTYRWSVRPVYHVDGAIKFGEWMKLGADRDSNSGHGMKKGIFGRQASAAPAYIQDFPLLEIKCGRR